MDVDIVITDQAYFEAKHDDIEQHIEKGDKEQLMRVKTVLLSVEKKSFLPIFYRVLLKSSIKVLHLNMSLVVSEVSRTG